MDKYIGEDGTCPTDGCIHNELMTFEDVSEGD